MKSNWRQISEFAEFLYKTWKNKSFSIGIFFILIGLVWWWLWIHWIWFQLASDILGFHPTEHYWLIVSIPAFMISAPFTLYWIAKSVPETFLYFIAFVWFGYLLIKVSGIFLDVYQRDGNEIFTLHGANRRSNPIIAPVILVFIEIIIGKNLLYKMINQLRK